MLRACFACLLVLPAAAQESFLPAPEKGDIWVARTETEAVLRLRVTPADPDSGGPADAGSTRRTAETQETAWLEAEGDAPGSWKVTFTESREAAGKPDADPARLELRPTDLEGHAWEVSASGELTPADAPEAVRARLRETETWRALLPPGPRRAGESWIVPAARLARLVVRGAEEPPDGASEFKVTFQEIAGEGDARSAVLVLEGRVAVDSRQGFRVEYDVRGSLRYDLSRQRPLALDVAGEAVVLEGAVKDRDGEVIGTVEGRGTRFEMRTRWTFR
jgi:hypothetical protein